MHFLSFDPAKLCRELSSALCLPVCRDLATLKEPVNKLTMKIPNSFVLLLSALELTFLTRQEEGSCFNKTISLYLCTEWGALPWDGILEGFEWHSFVLLWFGVGFIVVVPFSEKMGLQSRKGRLCDGRVCPLWGCLWSFYHCLPGPELRIR